MLWDRKRFDFEKEKYQFLELFCGRANVSRQWCLTQFVLLFSYMQFHLHMSSAQEETGISSWVL